MDYKDSFQEIKKLEIRNFIIDLINNNNKNFISFNLSIKHFIIFFSSKNKDKNRNMADKFIRILNPVIKLYRRDKKIVRLKKINRVKTKSLAKKHLINVDKNNLFKEKTERYKNIQTNNNK